MRHPTANMNQTDSSRNEGNSYSNSKRKMSAGHGHSDSFYKGSERGPGKKKFKNESDLNRSETGGVAMRKSTGHSERSPSLFEEISMGGDVDQVAADDPAMRKNRARSLTRIQGIATNDNQMQENLL